MDFARATGSTDQTTDETESASRRAMLRAGLRAGAAAGAAVALGAVGVGTAGAAGAAGGKSLPYPDVTDTSHASERAARIFRGFFSAKSRHDPDELMTYFSRTDAYYIDASSGSIWPDWQALDDVFHAFLPPAPPEALSYPLRIVGDERSALVEFEDTPELFGSELRILGSVTFDERGKIVRWIDYWDGRSSLRQTSIGPTYPTEFKDDVSRASPAMRRAATRLQEAFTSGDAAAAVAAMSFDAVLEDMAAHTRVRGRPQIQRYLSRALGRLPYGPGASVAHVDGSEPGGGYEWHAAPVAAPMRRGHTALELDRDGQISRITAVYDSGLLSLSDYQALVALAAEPPV
jgi:hypothetical protein